MGEFVGSIGELIEALHLEMVRLQGILDKQDEPMKFLTWLKSKDEATVRQAWKMFKDETKVIEF